MRTRRLWAACCLGLSLAIPASAQTGPNLVNTRALSFGKFAVQGSGSVTLSPNGARSASGGVVLLISSPGASAEFTASDPDPARVSSAYIITLPSDGTVALTGSSGSMALNGFTSEPASTGMLSGGSQVFQVGATLSVSAGQPPGAYSGSFAVTVNYQ